LKALRRPGSDGSWSSAGQGFMSTQRREYRYAPATKTSRRGSRCRSKRIHCTERARESELRSSALDTHFGRARACGKTARPETPATFHPSDQDLSPGAPVRLATKSLQTDHPLEKLVWQDNRLGSPPPVNGNRAATGTPATPRSSLSHILIPSGFTHIHSTLPQVPAGFSRWAERYDGKRDLHFQHAA